MSQRIIAVTGLSAEARIAAGVGVVTVAGGGDSARLALLLGAALDRGAEAVISFGVAGGLRPDLRPGATIIARSVEWKGGRIATAPGWRTSLAAALPHALVADLAAVDEPLCAVADKRDMHERTGAVAVDMESHVAGSLAARYKVPFAALRVVADPAERTVPQAATTGMRSDGSTDVGAVLRALCRRPQDLPDLLRTAWDAHVAFSALARSRRALCDAFGFASTTEEAGITAPAFDSGLPASAETG